MSDTSSRPHAHERFVGAEHHLQLAQIFADLENEARAAQNGHRQITVFHRAPVTIVAFSFDDGGELHDHSAAGLVTIQAVQTTAEGVLEVRTASHNYQLQSGEIVVLEPNVVHSVSSRGASKMLLTIHLEKHD